jgi:hypothetical protein
MTHILMHLQVPSVFSSRKWLQSEYINGLLLLFQPIDGGARFHALNYGWAPLKDEKR